MPAVPIFKEELRNYTSAEYSFEVRQSAFRYINGTGLYNEMVIDNLIDASVHHNWRFRSFSRGLLTEIFKNPGTKEAIKNKLAFYTTKEQAYLKKVFLE